MLLLLHFHFHLHLHILLLRFHCWYFRCCDLHLQPFVLLSFFFLHFFFICCCWQQCSLQFRGRFRLVSRKNFPLLTFLPFPRTSNLIVRFLLFVHFLILSKKFPEVLKHSQFLLICPILFLLLGRRRAVLFSAGNAGKLFCYFSFNFVLPVFVFAYV